MRGFFYQILWSVFYGKRGGTAVPLNRHCEPQQRRGNLLHLAHSLKHGIQAVVVKRDSGDYKLHPGNLPLRGRTSCVNFAPGKIHASLRSQ